MNLTPQQRAAIASIAAEDAAMIRGIYIGARDRVMADRELAHRITLELNEALALGLSEREINLASCLIFLSRHQWRET